MSNSGITTIEVKKINRKTVYELIYKEKAISKQEIASKLNMGLTTVTHNLKALEDDGLICRTGFYESTGGRKAQAIEIVRNVKTAVGVFILNNRVIMAALDLYGEVISKKTISRDFCADDEYYRFLGKEIMMFANTVESNPEKILGVGIAIQGIISHDGNSIQYGKILKHTGLKIEDLTQYIPYKCILVHDSKAAAYAEIWTSPTISDAIVFLLNNNLGSAIVIDREIYNGKSMYSGTIEHMCIEPQGKSCYCGGHGCLEAYCSAKSLKQSIDGMPLEDFFTAIRNNDAAYTPIWQNYLNNLAFAIKNSITVLDCDIVISGFLAPFLETEDISYLLKEIYSDPFFSSREIEILIGKHDETAPAVGAALPFIKDMVNNIV